MRDCFQLSRKVGEAFASKVSPQEHKGCPDLLPDAILQKEAKRRQGSLEPKKHKKKEIGFQIDFDACVSVCVCFSEFVSQIFNRPGESQTVGEWNVATCF